jgi:hypothetical protein
MHVIGARLGEKSPAAAEHASHCMASGITSALSSPPPPVQAPKYRERERERESVVKAIPCIIAPHVQTLLPQDCYLIHHRPFCLPYSLTKRPSSQQLETHFTLRPSPQPVLPQSYPHFKNLPPTPLYLHFQLPEKTGEQHERKKERKRSRRTRSISLSPSIGDLFCIAHAPERLR